MVYGEWLMGNSGEWLMVDGEWDLGGFLDSASFLWGLGVIQVSALSSKTGVCRMRKVRIAWLICL